MKSRLQMIEEFHERLLNKYRDVETSRPLICGWGSLHNQEMRFSALLKILKYNGGSIVDFGCGTGDLYPYIVRNYGEVPYTGVDSNERMLKIAKQAHHANFIRCEFDEINFEPAEFVVASGIFQYKDVSNPTYYEELIRVLFSKAQIALAVNFLVGQNQNFEKFNNELFFQPAQILELANANSPLWAIDHSYHLGSGDITMALFHK